MHHAKVFLLLGGLVGFDGDVTSAGMFKLEHMLEELPGVSVKSYAWSSFMTAAYDVQMTKTLKVVVGYSGGGSRATWLANAIPMTMIDLMVLYDPSPWWETHPIGHNVKQGICYHNTKPEMWVPFIGQIGGGKLVGTGNIITQNFAQQHLLVQFNEELHNETVKYVKKLITG